MIGWRFSLFFSFVFVADDMLQLNVNSFYVLSLSCQLKDSHHHYVSLNLSFLNSYFWFVVTLIMFCLKYTFFMRVWVGLLRDSQSKQSSVTCQKIQNCGGCHKLFVLLHCQCVSHRKRNQSSMCISCILYYLFHADVTWLAADMKVCAVLKWSNDVM